MSVSWSKTKKIDNFELVKYIRVTQMFRLILGEFLSVKMIAFLHVQMLLGIEILPKTRLKNACENASLRQYDLFELIFESLFAKFVKFNFFRKICPHELHDFVGDGDLEGVPVTELLHLFGLGVHLEQVDE